MCFHEINSKFSLSLERIIILKQRQLLQRTAIEKMRTQEYIDAHLARIKMSNLQFSPYQALLGGAILGAVTLARLFTFGTVTGISGMVQFPPPYYTVFICY